MINAYINKSIRDIVINIFASTGLVKSFEIIEGVEIYTLYCEKVKDYRKINNDFITKFISTFIDSGCACSIGGLILIGDKFDNKIRKFIIGHELGHLKHGDDKITVLGFIKNVIRFIITRQCYVIGDLSKEFRADEYARNFCGYSITAEEMVNGVLQNYQYSIDDFETRQEEIKSYLLMGLTESGRFQ